MMTKTKIETIDLTPKWEGIIGAMMDVLENPEATFESKKIIREEITKLARAVDEMNAITKE